jgi:hypothetical protein
VDLRPGIPGVGKVKTSGPNPVRRYFISCHWEVFVHVLCSPIQCLNESVKNNLFIKCDSKEKKYFTMSHKQINCPLQCQCHQHYIIFRANVIFSMYMSLEKTTFIRKKIVYKMLMKLTTGDNFFNVLWATFMHADLKSTKKTVKFLIFFVLLGSAHAKAAHKMLMKLTFGVYQCTTVVWAGVLWKMKEFCVGQSFSSLMCID